MLQITIQQLAALTLRPSLSAGLCVGQVAAMGAVVLLPDAAPHQEVQGVHERHLNIGEQRHAALRCVAAAAAATVRKLRGPREATRRQLRSAVTVTCCASGSGCPMLVGSRRQQGGETKVRMEAECPTGRGVAAKPSSPLQAAVSAGRGGAGVMRTAAGRCRVLLWHHQYNLQLLVASRPFEL